MQVLKDPCKPRCDNKPSPEGLAFPTLDSSESEDEPNDTSDAAGAESDGVVNISDDASRDGDDSGTPPAWFSKCP